MKEVDEFVACVKRGEIPQLAPRGLCDNSWKGFSYQEDTINLFRARTECTDYGMWAIVDLKWTKELAEWIGKRGVLEVMGGFGWLAKALAVHGVSIVCTDDYSWKEDKKYSRHKKGALICPVIELEAVKAVKQASWAEVLIISWPPYEDDTICRVAEAWGSKRPIVYIGESNGGCNAPEEFFEYFKEIENQLSVLLPHWEWIHDEILIGYYSKGGKSETGKIKSRL